MCANDIVQARTAWQRNSMNFQLQVLIRVKERVQDSERGNLTLAEMRLPDCQWLGIFDRCGKDWEWLMRPQQIF